MCVCVHARIECLGMLYSGLGGAVYFRIIDGCGITMKGAQALEDDFQTPPSKKTILDKIMPEALISELVLKDKTATNSLNIQTNIRTFETPANREMTGLL